MIAAIQLPLWTIAVAFLVICWAIDLASTRRKRRAGEARRLRALDALWNDGVTEGLPNGPRDQGPSASESGHARAGGNTAVARGGSAPSVTSWVSPRPAATDAGGLGDAAA